MQLIICDRTSAINFFVWTLATTNRVKTFVTVTTFETTLVEGLQVKYRETTRLVITVIEVYLN